MLEAVKEDRGYSARILDGIRSTERNELRAFSSLIDAMMEVIFPRVIAAHTDLQILELKLSVVEAMFLWGLDRETLISLIHEMSIEYCTTEEFAARAETARAQSIPLAQAVDLVLDSRAGDPVSAHRRSTVGRELRALVRGGSLQGDTNGSRVQVNVGSLHDWLGLPVRPRPTWGKELRAGSAREVSLFRSLRGEFDRQLALGPHSGPQIHPALAPSHSWLLEEDALTPYDLVVRQIVATLPDGIGRLRADSIALSSMLDEFTDVLEVDDASHPRLRVLMTDLEDRVTALAARIAFYAGAPDAEADHARADDALMQLRADLRGYAYFR
jgi:hypothetical protein